MRGREQSEAVSESADYEEITILENDKDEEAKYGSDSMISLVRRNDCHNGRRDDRNVYRQVLNTQFEKVIEPFHQCIDKIP